MRSQPVCRSCGEPIIWACTAMGRRMPVNLRPDPAGTLVLVVDGKSEGTLVLSVQSPLGKQIGRAHV